MWFPANCSHNNSVSYCTCCLANPVVPVSKRSMQKSSARNRISLGQCPRVDHHPPSGIDIAGIRIIRPRWKSRGYERLETPGKNVWKCVKSILKPGSEIYQNSQICLRSCLFHVCFDLEARLPSPPPNIHYQLQSQEWMLSVDNLFVFRPSGRSL